MLGVWEKVVVGGLMGGAGAGGPSLLLSKEEGGISCYLH